MEENKVKDVLLTDIATDTSGNENINELTQKPTDKSIVLVELVHMLYNSAVILEKLSDNDKDEEAILGDSKTLVSVADRYMIKLKETLNECETGKFTNQVNINSVDNDEEIKDLIDKLSEEIKDDVREEDNQ